MRSIFIIAVIIALPTATDARAERAEIIVKMSAIFDWGGYCKLFSQNALDNAQWLFKAVAARETNLDEPISGVRITDVAVQIGLEGAEFDSALDYAADQGWFEDAEVDDDASWVSLTPVGVAAAKSNSTARNLETACRSKWNANTRWWRREAAGGHG
jgi:hypothetical protein